MNATRLPTSSRPSRPEPAQRDYTSHVRLLPKPSHLQTNIQSHHIHAPRPRVPLAQSRVLPLPKHLPSGRTIRPRNTLPFDPPASANVSASTRVSFLSLFDNFRVHFQSEFMTLQSACLHVLSQEREMINIEKMAAHQERITLAAERLSWCQERQDAVRERMFLQQRIEPGATPAVIAGAPLPAPEVKEAKKKTKPEGKGRKRARADSYSEPCTGSSSSAVSFASTSTLVDADSDTDIEDGPLPSLAYPKWSPPRDSPREFPPISANYSNADTIVSPTSLSPHSAAPAPTSAPPSSSSQLSSAMSIYSLTQSPLTRARSANAILSNERPGRNEETRRTPSPPSILASPFDTKARPLKRRRSAPDTSIPVDAPRSKSCDQIVHPHDKKPDAPLPIDVIAEEYMLWCAQKTPLTPVMPQTTSSKLFVTPSVTSVESDMGECDMDLDSECGYEMEDGEILDVNDALLAPVVTSVTPPPPRIPSSPAQIENMEQVESSPLASPPHTPRPRTPARLPSPVLSSPTPPATPPAPSAKVLPAQPHIVKPTQTPGHTRVVEVLNPNRLDLMYIRFGGRIICRACFVKHKATCVDHGARVPPADRKSCASSSVVESFPLLVKRDVLLAHCVRSHPTVCADIARMNPPEVKAARDLMWNGIALKPAASR